MATDDPMMRLRIPPDLKERIQEAARYNDRSMNAEILHRIRDSLDREDAAMRDRPARRPLNLGLMSEVLAPRVAQAPGEAPRLPAAVMELTALVTDAILRQLEGSALTEEEAAERIERIYLQPAPAPATEADAAEASEPPTPSAKKPAQRRTRRS